MEPDEKLTPEQLAAELQLTPKTLAMWRAAGRGPRYLLLGDRSARYQRRDVDDWLERRAVDPAAAR